MTTDTGEADESPSYITETNRKSKMTDLILTNKSSK